MEKSYEDKYVKEKKERREKLASITAPNSIKTQETFHKIMGTSEGDSSWDINY